MVIDPSFEKLERELISAYEQILSSRRQETLLQMQALTMREKPIRTAMKAGLGEVCRLVQEAFRSAGIPDPEDRTILFWLGECFATYPWL